MTTTGIENITLEGITCTTFTGNNVTVDNLVTDSINMTSLLSIPPQDTINMQSGGLLTNGSDLSTTTPLLKVDTILPETPDIIIISDDSGTIDQISFDQSINRFMCTNINTTTYHSATGLINGGPYTLAGSAFVSNCSLAIYDDTLTIFTPTTTILTTATNLLSLASDASSGNLSLTGGVITVAADGIYAISVDPGFVVLTASAEDEIIVSISVSLPVSVTLKGYYMQITNAITDVATSISATVYAASGANIIISAHKNDIANTYVYSGYTTIVRII